MSTLAGFSDWNTQFNELEIPISISSDTLLSECYYLISNGGRISLELGIKLFNHSNLSGILALGNLIKKSRYGNYVYFNENLHVNTTNICILACRFCAFRKGPRHSEAYSLNVKDYIKQIMPYSDRIDEIHSVGGLHPEWKIEHYEELYRESKKKYPNIMIKSLTAVEIKHIANRSGLSIQNTLIRLSDAGLDSLPGGGAEILVDTVRNRICRGKESSEEYLNIHKIAHNLGISTNCTMLFGTVETLDERAIHLDKLRKLQDETNGFQCFVPYPFLPDKSRLPEAQLATLNEILRVIAISRIMLDNIPHIKAYRMNLGSQTASLALLVGADDLDGTVSHEEIMQEAGSNARLDTDSDELSRLIESIDSIPIKRNTLYTEFSRFQRKLSDDSRRLPIAQQA
ncbi:MAG: CofH family radical SAM protein [Euryarchaeota archaeon]|jgi:aminodeoxyfutalosine synthase|nr:CofH family radical SAM protein [Euryarchaeota archaeon]MBT5996371.1 CofH family radical SAM protein [Candidatus Neomarinimicrobiota bacterium]MBT3757529.1 CofH family radical SAM protein [Euryarchaeota archaeon]MBT4050621.1 CofH family radical SAM protein [Euryarchaeota archaeon]MBT4650753.1 CofH family radical SAM protein [Euryarchaeota archaeon]|tara:strand:- start:5491 stop:6690 length:1200 start_codon:yes stop_codon:yes gene_type:complete